MILKTCRKLIFAITLLQEIFKRKKKMQNLCEFPLFKFQFTFIVAHLSKISKTWISYNILLITLLKMLLCDLKKFTSGVDLC